MDRSDTESQNLKKKIYGWGAECELVDSKSDIGRDICLANRSGGSGLDFKTIEGFENLAQALSIALTTALGADIFNNKYGYDGLNALAQESNPILVRERMRIAVVKLLLKDYRVRRIVDVKMEEDSNEEIKRTFIIKVQFETITLEQVTLDLGKAVPNV